MHVHSTMAATRLSSRLLHRAGRDVLLYLLTVLAFVMLDRHPEL
jgi:hypothetical protein